MCGIFGLLNTEYITKFQYIKKLFENENKRGPDYSTINMYEKINAILGFHRLSINGLDSNSNQPIHINNKILICNGEIYNYKEFYNNYSITPQTNSDCEAIIYMYEKFGIEGALQYMDGVFAFMLFDYSDIETIKLFVARDPFGVRPLFKFNYYDEQNIDDAENECYKIIGFSSEMKYFYNLIDKEDATIDNVKYIQIKDVQQFKPGTYMEYYLNTNYTPYMEYNSNLNTETNYTPSINLDINRNYRLSSWKYGCEKMYYYVNTIQDIKNNTDIENITGKIRQTLENAVLKRVETTDRPIACLLSGGLDSSLITSLVHKLYSKEGRILETYSIGMVGGEDLKYAKMVAKFLGTKHTSIELTEQEFLDAIPEVVRVTETYDTTTIRASVGNYLVSKYISENSNAKVIFNGDGSDEVTGGYMYFHYAPDAVSFDIECKRLLNDIHFFDVLRSDRSISNNGLEARTPFLDKRFVQCYLSIPKELRYNTHKKYCEKYLLRKAFDDGTYLPDNVLWRTKEAFSDGVSSQTRSWYEIIEEHIREKNITSVIGNNEYIREKLVEFKKKQGLKDYINITDEQLYYYYLYCKNYNYGLYYDYDNCNIIPYYWMPKFVIANDASARTLSVYNNK